MNNSFTRNLTLLIACFASLVNVAAADTIDLQLDVGDPELFLVQPGDTTPLAITATNNGDEPVAGILKASIESYDGSSFDLQGPMALKPGETGRLPIPRESLGELGIKWVHADFRSGDNRDEPLAKEELAFAYMQPVGNEHAQGQEMLLGIAYGAGPDNRSETCAKAVARVGFGLKRSLMRWSAEEPDFDRIFDEEFGVHRQYGVEPYLMFNGTAPFARLEVNGRKGNNSPPDPKAWRRWTRQAAEAVRRMLPADQPVYWEIWNEPDIGFFSGTTEQYLEMLDIAHEEINAVDAENFHVMTGGFASIIHPGGKEGMIERVITEREEDWEQVAYHEHGEFDKFLRGLEEQLQPILDRADKPTPIFLTETGMDTRHGQHFQARELIKKIVYSWGRGFTAYTWFNLHDMPNTLPRQPGRTYGLYTSVNRRPTAPDNRWGDPTDYTYEDTYPKASYVAMNTLNTVLQSVKCQGRLDFASNDRYVYTFADSGQQVVVSWDQSDAGTTALYLLPTDASKAEVVDIMGNRTTAPIVEGYAILEVSPTPTFLVLHGGKEKLRLGTTLAETIETDDGASAVRINNPFQQPITVDYEWQIANMLQLADGESGQGVVTIRPGESAVVAAKAELKGGREFSLGSTHFSRLEYSIQPYDLRGGATVPHVLNAVSVPPVYRNWNSFALERQSQVVNRFEHDPHTIHLMWKGWADKSSPVKLQRNNGNLCFQAKVVDDRHHPLPNDISNGDCVILGLSVPEQEGVWRWAITTVDGKAIVKTLESPANLTSTLPTVNAQDSTLEIVVDEESLGIQDKHYQDGLRFNLSLVDNDGERQGVECYLHAAPVSESGDINPDDWPRLILFDRN